MRNKRIKPTIKPFSCVCLSCGFTAKHMYICSQCGSPRIYYRTGQATQVPVYRHDTRFWKRIYKKYEIRKGWLGLEFERRKK